MPGVARVAVFAAQHMPANTQPNTHARAPRHVGAVGQGLPAHTQRTPTPLGLQSGNRVVFDAHVFKSRPQWPFHRRGGPVVGQPSRAAGQSATNIRRGQLNQPAVHHKRPARRHANRRQTLHGQPG